MYNRQVHDDELDQSNLCTCYRTGIENIILDEKRPICLSKEKVYSLCSLLEYECSRFEERTYPLSITESSFYEALVEFISPKFSKIEEKRIKKEISKLEEARYNLHKTRNGVLKAGFGAMEFLYAYLSSK